MTMTTGGTDRFAPRPRPPDCAPQGRRAAPRAPARSTLELRDPADLRRPATAIRRRATRPQPYDALARLRTRLGGLRPIPADQRRGTDRASARPAAPNWRDWREAAPDSPGLPRQAAGCSCALSR